MRSIPVRLSAIAVSLGCVALPSLASARLPGVLTQEAHHPFAVRPASIGYTGDGTGILGGQDGSSARRPGHLHWKIYTNRQGLAFGVNWLNDCEPDCAEGEFHPVPVTVHVFAPRNGHFTRLTLQFTYNGESVTDRRGIRHFGSGGFSYWAYYIISTR